MSTRNCRQSAEKKHSKMYSGTSRKQGMLNSIIISSSNQLISGQLISNDIFTIYSEIIISSSNQLISGQLIFRNYHFFF